MKWKLSIGGFSKVIRDINSCRVIPRHCPSIVYLWFCLWSVTSTVRIQYTSTVTSSSASFQVKRVQQTIHLIMGGSFPTIARFQDSDFFQKAIKNSIEMHVECDFSTFRIPTLTLCCPWLMKFAMWFKMENRLGVWTLGFFGLELYLYNKSATL